MRYVIELLGVVLLVLFFPFLLMWSAYLASGKALDMPMYFNSEGFWVFTVLWWFIGCGIIIGSLTKDTINKNIEP